VVLVRTFDDALLKLDANGAMAAAHYYNFGSNSAFAISI